MHTTYDLHYNCNSTDVHVMDKYPCGVKFVGENGDWLYCCRSAGKVTPSDPVPAARPGEMKPLDASKPSLLAPLSKVSDDVLGRGGERFLTVADHYENWLEAIAREDPSYTVTDAEGGHKSTAFCSPGRMCMELSRGKKDGGYLNWDAKKEISGNAEADRMLVPFARGKYDLRNSLKAAGFCYDKMIKPLAVAGRLI